MKNLKYVPLGSRVVVSPIPEDEKDKMVGSIVMVDSAIIFEKATVIAVGKGDVARDSGEPIPMEVKIGDVVLLRRELPHLPLIVNGEPCKLIREGDIEAIVEEVPV